MNIKRTKKMKYFIALNIVLLALIVGVVSTKSYFETADLTRFRDSSCGEDDRSVDVDVDGDGEKDRTVTFEMCYLRKFDIDGEEKKIVVYYTLNQSLASDNLRDLDTDGDGIVDLSSNEIAESIADWTQLAWMSYHGSGFGDPKDKNEFEVFVFDHPFAGGWCCTSNRYELDAPSIIYDFVDPNSHSLKAKETVFHEMWHAVEWTNKGNWISEGTAVTMPDSSNILLDLLQNSGYQSLTNEYLTARKSESLTTVDYHAGLWWKYYMEQVGTITTEPNRGVDAMRLFWQNLETDGLTTLDNIIQSQGDGRSLETIWIDFTVANYAKELMNPNLPEKYRYQDELQTGAADYPPITLDFNQALSNNSNLFGNGTVAPWAARYYQFRPDASVPFISLEFRQDTAVRVAYTLLLIKNGEMVHQEEKIGRDFVWAQNNEDYDKVIVIVTGLAEFANYRYTLNASQPSLKILNPLTNRQAVAGPHDAPEKILIKAEILSPIGGGTPVEGLDFDNFEITIGNQQVQSGQRISHGYIQGQYWFVVLPPAQTSNRSYDLSVTYTPSPILSETQMDAVNYVERADFENMLVIDRSGSMNDWAKIYAAKDAASLYVDSWGEGDAIGVISYNENATVDLSLREWNDSNRNQALNTIESLVAAGNTSIGDGLIIGMEQLIERGSDPGPGWAMILLSDGLETAEPYIDEFMTQYYARRDNGEKLPQIHTVALGPDADRAKLEWIASETQGTYHYASIPVAAREQYQNLQNNLELYAPTSVETIESDQQTMFGDLAEIYRVIAERETYTQQIHSMREYVPIFDSSTQTINVEKGASEAVFVLYSTDGWHLEGLFKLIRPDGTEVISSTLADTKHRVWRIPSPMSGEWTLTLEPICKYSCSTNFLIEASLKSDLTMEVFLGTHPQNRYIGQAIPILATLSQSEPVLNAIVEAEVTNPENQTLTIPLFDDGFHGDGEANDGFYGNIFYETAKEGGYVAIIHAEGSTEFSGDFNRRLRVSFNMKAHEDDDRDGLPNWWEDAYGTDPNSPDENSDPDGDGVSNIEEFEQGTYPLDSDSDDGGENDGSESANGTDPFDSEDDQIPCILDFQAFNRLYEPEGIVNPQASVLRFSVNPKHHHFILWRAEDESGPWLIINDNVPPTGLYIDDDLILDKRYYYRIQAVNNEGHESCILGPRSTIPSTNLFSNVYLPVVASDASFNYPDLIVDRITANNDNVTIVVKNLGSAPVTDPFWLDVYFAPDIPPTKVNQRWDQIGSEGLVWGITSQALPLPPGDTLSLTLNDKFYSPTRSRFSGQIEVGTLIYAQVDSWNSVTDFGAVFEKHEAYNQTYNNIEYIVVNEPLTTRLMPEYGKEFIRDYEDLPPRALLND